MRNNWQLGHLYCHFVNMFYFLRYYSSRRFKVLVTYYVTSSCFTHRIKYTWILPRITQGGFSCKQVTVYCGNPHNYLLFRNFFRECALNDKDRFFLYFELEQFSRLLSTALILSHAWCIVLWKIGYTQHCECGDCQWARPYVRLLNECMNEYAYVYSPRVLFIV